MPLQDVGEVLLEVGEAMAEARRLGAGGEELQRGEKTRQRPPCATETRESPRPPQLHDQRIARSVTTRRRRVKTAPSDLICSLTGPDWLAAAGGSVGQRVRAQDLQHGTHTFKIRATAVHETINI